MAYGICSHCGLNGSIEPDGQGGFICSFCDHGGPKKSQPYRTQPNHAREGEPEGSDATGRKELLVTSLADVPRQEVRWRWPGRLPVGKLVMLDGDPEVGKSFLCMEIAAAVTKGLPLPGDDAAYQPQKVLILNAEDGIADTMVPRAEDAGADTNKIIAVTATRLESGLEEHFQLDRDVEELAEILRAREFGLVIIDPINAYLGSKVDTYRDSSVRAVLTPLAQLAERYEVTVLALRHLTQSARDKAIYRGQGSIAYTAAARTVLLVGKNPDCETERVIHVTKSNLADKPSALAFEIVEGRIHWLGDSDVTVAAVLGAEKTAEEQSQLGEAENFLLQTLVDGPVEVKQLRKQAEELGLGWRTVERAKKRLQVQARSAGAAGKVGASAWSWRLPDEELDRQDRQGE